MIIKNNVAVSDSGFVFNPNTGESFSFNPIGLEIFRLMKEGKSKDQISKAIMAGYQVDEPAFERDYDDFINVLKHYHLIEADEKEKN
jgi:hypothetical protein